MSIFMSCDKKYICYTEKETYLLNTVDEKIRKEAIVLGALEYHIPAMIDRSILAKCGYFSSFPQHLTIAAHAKRDTYRQIAQDNYISENTSEISQCYFTPAACLHIYPMFENSDPDQKVITTKARVYRYEDNNFDGVTRLWDFTVREIVFIGSIEFVSDCLEQMKIITIDYTKKIGLPADIQSAADNFYPTKINSVKQRLQLSNSLKSELLVEIDGKLVAISSFNYHGTHFSKPFSFDKNGSVVTGCVGYGLERWVAALNHHKIVI